MEKYSKEWLLEKKKDHLYKLHTIISDTRFMIDMADLNPNTESILVNTLDDLERDRMELLGEIKRIMETDESYYNTT